MLPRARPPLLAQGLHAMSLRLRTSAGLLRLAVSVATLRLAGVAGCSAGPSSAVDAQSSEIRSITVDEALVDFDQIFRAGYVGYVKAFNNVILRHMSQ